MKKLIALLTPGALLALPLVALAQGGTTGPTTGPGGSAGGFQNLIDLATSFKAFLDILTVVVIAAALVFFFWGLALFILSAGDEEKRSKGKQVMLWGIIALTIIVAVWGIVTWLLDAFGITAIETTITPGVGN